MSYTDFFTEIIKEYEAGEPIYITDLTDRFIKEYFWEKRDIPDKNKAARLVSMAIQRVFKNHLVPELRFYKKGIWYKTKETVFGEVEIDNYKILKRKYLDNYNGYVTGYEALRRLGITTQMPREVVIATNAAKKNKKRDDVLQVIISPPKTKITPKNINYLQLLDIIEIMHTSIITCENPYQLVADVIKKFQLKYEVLMRLASKYYNKKTVLETAKVAEFIVDEEII